MRIFFRLVIANFKEILRDVMLLFWFLLFPIVFALIFGFLFSNIGFGGNEQANNAIPSATFNVGIVNDNSDPLNKALEDQIIKSIPMFIVHSGNYDDEIEEFKSGRRNIVIVLPGELSKETANKKSIDIPVYYDYQGASALFGISEILNGIERNITGRPQLFSIKLHNEVTDNEDSSKSREEIQEKSGDDIQKVPKQIDYTLPGVLAITLMQLGLFGSLRVIGLRAQKTLKSLGATPLPRGLFLAGEITVRLFLSLIQALIIVAIGHFVFDLTLSSNWFYIF